MPVAPEISASGRHRVPGYVKEAEINKYDHPTLGWMIDHWTLMIVLFSLLLLVTGLVLITRWWHQKDEAARLATYRRV